MAVPAESAVVRQVEQVPAAKEDDEISDISDIEDEFPTNPSEEVSFIHLQV